MEHTNEMHGGQNSFLLFLRQFQTGARLPLLKIPEFSSSLPIVRHVGFLCCST